MSLLLTLASDPYDRPGHWMPWRRRCGAAEDLHPSWPRRIPCKLYAVGPTKNTAARWFGRTFGFPRPSWACEIKISEMPLRPSLSFHPAISSH